VRAHGSRDWNAPLECDVDRPEALVVVLRVVVAALAVAAEAVLPRGEALAVEFQATRVAAVALAALLGRRLAVLTVRRHRAPRTRR